MTKDTEALKNRIHRINTDKVITTMVIGLLDDNDRTYCAQSAFTHLGLTRKMHDCSLYHFTTSQCLLKRAPLTFSSTSNQLVEIWKGGGLLDPGFEGRGWQHLIALQRVPISSSLTNMVHPLPFLSYLGGYKSVSARPTQIWWQIPPQKLLVCRAAKK